MAADKHAEIAAKADLAHVPCELDRAAIRAGLRWLGRHGYGVTFSDPHADPDVTVEIVRCPLRIARTTGRTAETVWHLHDDTGAFLNTWVEWTHDGKDPLPYVWSMGIGELPEASGLRSGISRSVESIRSPRHQRRTPGK